MAQVERPAAGFEQSFALFDDAGRLVDWNAGFIREFGAAGELIAPGASLRALILAAYAGDDVAIRDLAAWSQFDPTKLWSDAEAVAIRTQTMNTTLQVKSS